MDGVMSTPGSGSINVAGADRGLETCFKQASLPSEFLTAVRDVVGVVTLDDFVNYVTQSRYEDELVGLREAAGPAFKDKPLILSRLRTAWRAGRKALDELEQKQANKPYTEDVEDALPDESVREIDKLWRDTHGFVIDVHLSPSDSLVARLFREFRRCTPTFIPVEKVKTLLAAQRPPREQREKLGRWTLAKDEEEDTRVDSVVEYYWALRTLGYACSLAGHFDHDSKAKEGTKVRFSVFEANLNYADISLRQTLTVGVPSHRQVMWLRSRDQATRGRMIVLMRQGWPQTEALAAARSEFQVLWSSAGLDESDSRKRSQSGGGGGGSGGGGGGGGDAPETPPKRQRTATTLPGGRSICKAYNDDRGCSRNEGQCPRKQAHVCDKITSAGKVCGGRHPRSTCTA